MIAFFRCSLPCLSLFLSFGCGTRDATPPVPEVRDERLEQRWFQAVGIQDAEKRDEAMAQIAVEAAEAKDLRITSSALASWKNVARRDETARSCALKFAAFGKRDEARLIADMRIDNLDLRAKTLAEIEKSKTEK